MPEENRKIFSVMMFATMWVKMNAAHRVLPKT